jgi:hypothetical protein
MPFVKHRLTIHAGRIEFNDNKNSFPTPPSFAVFDFVNHTPRQPEIQAKHGHQGFAEPAPQLVMSVCSPNGSKCFVPRLPTQAGVSGSTSGVCDAARTAPIIRHAISCKKVLHTRSHECKLFSVIKENHPSELYHADTTTISKHGLDLIHKAPLVYKHSLTAQKKQTPAMRWGEIVHTYILEYNKFLDEYAIEPEGLDKRTKEGKAWVEETKQGGFRTVSYDEHESLKQMRHSILSNEAARNLLLQGDLIEPSVYWEEDGAKCRARPDVIGKHFIADLKTTSNIRNFSKDAFNFRYHVQAAFYLSGLQVNGFEPISFRFIVVETEPPFLCQVFLSDNFFLARGADEYKKNLADYIRCTEMNEWPGLPEMASLSLPAWAN